MCLRRWTQISVCPWEFLVSSRFLSPFLIIKFSLYHHLVNARVIGSHIHRFLCPHHGEQDFLSVDGYVFYVFQMPDSSTAAFSVSPGDRFQCTRKLMRLMP